MTRRLTNHPSQEIRVPAAQSFVTETIRITQQDQTAQAQTTFEHHRAIFSRA